MKNYKCAYYTIAILVGLMIGGCGQKKNGSVMPFELSDTDTLSFYDMFSRIDIIPLESDSNSSVGFHPQNEWKIYHGEHYILDKRTESLCIFDCEGHLLKQINHRGHGHGEYSQIYDFQINPYSGHLEMLDPMLGIYEYDATGDTFINHYRPQLLAVHYFASLTEDIYVLFSKYRKEDCKILFYSKAKDKIVAEAYPVPEFLYSETPWHSGESPFYCFDGELYFVQTYDGTLYHVKEDCTLEERYHWDFGKKNFCINQLPNDKDMEWYIDYHRHEAPHYATMFRYNAENEHFFMNHFEYDNKYYNIIIDKDRHKHYLINGFEEKISLVPEKMDDEALYYLMPGMLVEWFSKENDGQLVFPSSDPDMMYIVKYSFKSDE